ncbi:darobactin export ABC transporter permease subunit [Pseudoalteromonas luteoviolacea]|uniref:darobactin export ABC transporter permease subunit n=1 Tax=Pseudoalteromonas luteoviolacea TaxID=43657 RepID=UPI001B3A6A04|nr:darobactin export ABC transporter permease subunit [Pseudoalteromonas luteoviolacea]MBQ4878025.1 darobactin export ABC transporter permease subunit [Pseudoalteromonas luteoviolacea]MBQ4907121.1 darobactin export ABC transporter permease subunit [Pseudoalteromonas luteoviolacea]
MLTFLSSPKGLSSITGIFSLSLGTILLGVIIAFVFADNRINNGITGNIYKIETQFNLPNGEQVNSSQAPAALIPALSSLNEIKRVGITHREIINVLHNTTEIKEAQVYALDEAAFNMLSFSSNGIAAVENNQVYLSSTFARQLTNNPASLIGQTLKLGKLGRFQITQVIELDESLSIKPDLMIAFASTFEPVIQSHYGNWYDTHVHLFVELNNNTSLNLDQVVLENAPQIPGAPFTPSSFIHLSKRPISQLHYDLALPDELGTTFAKSSLYLIYGVCGFSFLLGCIGFFSAVSSVQISHLERIKTLLSIGGSYGQITLSALLDNKLSLLIASVLSLSVFYFGMQFLSAEFPLLTILSTAHMWIISICMLLLLASMYISIICLVIRKIVASQEDQTISRSAGVSTIWMTQLTIVMQTLITALVMFVAVSVTYELFSAKQADYGYDISRTHYAKLDGHNDRFPTRIRDNINTNHGRVSEVSSWRPFDKSANYISVSTAQQKLDEQLTPVHYFFAGPTISQVLALEVISSNQTTLALDKVNNDDGKTRVIVTQAFSKLFDNIQVDQLINHQFYADFGEGLTNIEIVQVVSNFYLGKVKADFDPIMIVLDDTKANTLLVKHDSPANLVSQLSLNSSEQALDAEFSDLSKIVFYLLFVVILNIVLIAMNTIANSLVDAERHSDSLHIMKQLGADLTAIFSFIFKKNVYLYLASSLIGVLLGYIILYQQLIPLDHMQFSFYHYALSLFVVVTLIAFIISLNFGVISKKYLSE